MKKLGLGDMKHLLGDNNPLLTRNNIQKRLINSKIRSYAGEILLRKIKIFDLITTAYGDRENYKC